MKKIIGLLFILASNFSYSQSTPTLKQVLNSGNVAYKIAFYDANRAAGFTSRSLVDKGYVDSVAAASGAGTVTSVNAGTNLSITAGSSSVNPTLSTIHNPTFSISVTAPIATHTASVTTPIITHADSVNISSTVVKMSGGNVEINTVPYIDGNSHVVSSLSTKFDIDNLTSNWREWKDSSTIVGYSSYTSKSILFRLIDRHTLAVRWSFYGVSNGTGTKSFTLPFLFYSPNFFTSNFEPIVSFSGGAYGIGSCGWDDRANSVNFWPTGVASSWSGSGTSVAAGQLIIPVPDINTLVLEGNSFMANTDLNFGIDNYLKSKGIIFSVSNHFAVSGSTMTDAVTVGNNRMNFSARLTADAAALKAGFSSRNIFCANEGLNELNFRLVEGETVANAKKNTYNSYVTLYSATTVGGMAQLGYRCFFNTLSPRDDVNANVNYETARQNAANKLDTNTINGRLRVDFTIATEIPRVFKSSLAKWANCYLLDYGDDPVIGQAGQWANTTYYNADKIHMTPVGYTYLVNNYFGKAVWKFYR